MELLKPWPRSSGAVAVAAAFAVAIGTAELVLEKLAGPGPKTTLAKRWVPIHEQATEVLRHVPRGATAWGTIFYGIENPGRVQLVQFAEGVKLASRLPESLRASLAPDYIVWGYPENRDSTLGLLRGGSNAMASLSILFPGQRFRLVALITATPYGVTRVYARMPQGMEFRSEGLPDVSMYDVTAGKWRQRVGEASQPTFRPVAPAVFRIGYDDQPLPRKADETMVAQLPAADYLLRVTFSASTGGGMIAASSAASVMERISELGPGLDFAPLQVGDREGFLTHRHAGGLLYLSLLRFDERSRISSISAYAIQGMAVAAAASDVLKPLPALTSWISDKSGGVVVAPTNNGVHVKGNASQFGYQIVSPPITVASGRQVSMKLDYRVQNGNVCTGVLNERQTEWLVAATRATTEFSFQSRRNNRIHIVFANCNPSPHGNDASEFEVFAGSYSDSARALYTDRLMNAGDHQLVRPMQ
jgi:hypothetical protein